MTHHVWLITGALFTIGLAMVAARRQLLAMLLGVELMVSAANIALVHHAGLISDGEGVAAALLIIAVAAAEVVVGLALILDVAGSGPADAATLTELRG